MKQICIILILIIFHNWAFCQKRYSTFNLQNDIGNFSNKMSNQDTIIVNSNLNICETKHYEKDVITKENDTVYIQVSYQINKKEWVTYEKRVYKYIPDDTLNFENLFSNNQYCKTGDNYPTFQIIYNKEDTLNLLTEGLIGKINATYYVERIKDKIYFDKDYYKPHAYEEIQESERVIALVDIQLAFNICFASTEFDFIFDNIEANTKIPIYISKESNYQIKDISIYKLRGFNIKQSIKDESLIFFQDILLDEEIAIFDFICNGIRYSVYLNNKGYNIDKIIKN